MSEYEQPYQYRTNSLQTKLSHMQVESWDIAESHGFHDPGKSRPEALALIHSEVSEALEADRDAAHDDNDYAEELADIIIRVIDHAETEGFDMTGEVLAKMERNAGREYKHGKNY